MLNNDLYHNKNFIEETVNKINLNLADTKIFDPYVVVLHYLSNK